MKKVFFLPKASGSAKPSFASPWLAPLAGYSDLAFRLLCRHYGASVAETEMVSAKGLIYRSPGTGELLLSGPEDQPLIIQLFGSEPEILAQAVLELRRHGHTAFDLNMGCPVRKVLRQKSGAALMADLQLARKIAAAMISAGKATGPELPELPARFGFKLRLPPGGGIEDFGRYLEDLGASWLTLHPRTASQGYGGRADWSQIQRLVEAVTIPVIASGDLHTPEAALQCLRDTGAATVMYARGALQNPLIFRQHEALVHNLPQPAMDANAIRTMIDLHIRLARESFNQQAAFGKMRSLLPRYVKGFPGIREFRANLCMCPDWDCLMETINNFWSEAS